MIENGGEYIIKIRGLPWSSTVDEIVDFFGECNIKDLKNGIHLTKLENGRPSGEAYIELKSRIDLEQALKKNRHYMGDRYIEVFQTNRIEKDFVVKRLGLYADVVDKVCVRLRGLPFDCSENDIHKFFSGLEIIPNGITFIKDDTESKVRDAYVQFSSKDAVEKALERHMQKIRHRYVEVFRSSLAEMSYQTASKIKSNMCYGRCAPYDRNDRFSRNVTGFKRPLLYHRGCVYFADQRVNFTSCQLWNDNSRSSHNNNTVDSDCKQNACDCISDDNNSIEEIDKELFQTFKITRIYAETKVNDSNDKNARDSDDDIDKKTIVILEEDKDNIGSTISTNDGSINVDCNTNEDRCNNNNNNNNDDSNNSNDKVDRSNSKSNDKITSSIKRCFYDSSCLTDAKCEDDILKETTGTTACRIKSEIFIENINQEKSIANNCSVNVFVDRPNLISSKLFNRCVPYIKNKSCSNETVRTIHMRGLPYKATIDDIIQFFKPFNPTKVHIICDKSGRSSGEADVEFTTHKEAVEAMIKDKQHIKTRYIELFLSGISQKSTMIKDDKFSVKKRVTKNLLGVSAKQCEQMLASEDNATQTGQLFRKENILTNEESSKEQPLKITLLQRPAELNQLITSTGCNKTA